MMQAVPIVVAVYAWMTREWRMRFYLRSNNPFR